MAERVQRAFTTAKITIGRGEAPVTDSRRRDHVGPTVMPAGRDPAGIDQATGRTSGGDLVRAVRQLPAGPDEVARVPVGVTLQVVLVLGLGLPERPGRRDLGDHLAGPQAGGVDVGDGVLGDLLLRVV